MFLKSKMYEKVLILPLDTQTLQQTVLIDGKKYQLSLPSIAHDLCKTYRRVGIFDFIDTLTNQIYFRPNILSAQQGNLRRATQYDFDKCAHASNDKQKFSGNGLVFSTHQWSDNRSSHVPMDVLT